MAATTRVAACADQGTLPDGADLVLAFGLSFSQHTTAWLRPATAQRESAGTAVGGARVEVRETRRRARHTW